MVVVIPEATSTQLLARFRGRVTTSCPTYPESIHVEVTDPQGGVWGLGLWYADFFPADPAAILGKTVVSASVDERTETLVVGFSDGTDFKIVPDPGDDADEWWELFTPEGLVLAYCPGGRWQLAKATDPVDSPRP
jgi:hypothetical protein